MTTVYISGCWDLFHIGHLNVLKRAKALGDFLVAGVNTDELASTYKDPPVIPYEQRRDIVAALDCVDATVPHSSLEDLTGFDEYGIMVRAVGPQYGKLALQRRCLAELLRRGVKIVILPRTENISTTLIKERIRK